MEKTDIGKTCGKMWGKPWKEFGTSWDVGNTSGKEIRKSGDVREHLEVVHVFDRNPEDPCMEYLPTLG